MQCAYLLIGHFIRHVCNANPQHSSVMNSTWTDLQSFFKCCWHRQKPGNCFLCLLLRCLRYCVNPLQQHNHLHANTQNHLNDIHKEELSVNQQFTVQHTNAFLPSFFFYFTEHREISGTYVNLFRPGDTAYTYMGRPVKSSSHSLHLTLFRG